MDELTLSVFDTDDGHRAATRMVLAHHLLEHHRLAAGGKFGELNASLRDQAGQVCGGLLATTHGLWLNVEFLWVAEPFRRRGHGTRMLAAVEVEAQARGCRRVYVDTGASPSTDFFLRRGYEVCGEIPDYCGGRPRYWLHKWLVRQPGGRPRPHRRADAGRWGKTVRLPMGCADAAKP